MINRLRPWWKLVAFGLVLIWHFLWLMLDIFFAGKKHHRGIYIRRSFCRSALKIFNLSVDLKGNPDRSSGLIISNHRSMLDPLVEMSFLNVYILSKAEVSDYPLIGRGAKETGVFFVHRHIDSSRKAALQSIQKLLVAGKPVLIYPEGTTQGTHLTADFRKGTFEVAFNNNVPVIPIMIEYPGPEYYWTDDPLMTYYKKIFSKPGKHKVIVRIGDEIYADSADALMNKTKETIDQMMVEARETRNSPKGLKLKS